MERASSLCPIAGPRRPGHYQPCYQEGERERKKREIVSFPQKLVKVQKRPVGTVPGPQKSEEDGGG